MDLALTKPMLLPTELSCPAPLLLTTFSEQVTEASRDPRHTGQVAESASPIALLSPEVLAPCVDRRHWEGRQRPTHWGLSRHLMDRKLQMIL